MRTRHPLSKRAKRTIVSSVLGVSLVAGGTGAWALNRFVVDHVEIANVSAYEASLGVTQATSASDTTSQTSASLDGATSSLTATTTETSYTSDDTEITITTVTTGTGADTSPTTSPTSSCPTTRPSCARRSPTTPSATNIVADTSTIAARVGAVFAINGDYYGFRTPAS
jgi:hypothetical protein